MQTLFEKLGGEETVHLVVDKFYERVLNDDRIKRFFDGVDMFKQKIHQLDFLTYAFEGSERYPRFYNERSTSSACGRNGIK